MKPQTGKRKLKPSGIDWIGDVPEGWEVRRIKYLVGGEGTVFMDGDWINSDIIVDDGVRYLTSGNVGVGVFKRQGNGHITDETFKELNCLKALPGDLMLCRLNEPLGRGCIIPDDEAYYVIAVDNVILRPEKDYDKRYIMHCVSCDRFSTAALIAASGATMQRISRSDLGRLSIPIPPHDEQKRIAAKLDRLCGRIDELSANLTKEIAALQDYRKSLITECVTKGLNPKAKMKPSGVEWIGDVPEGWTVMRLKYGVTKIGSGKTPLGGATVYSDDGILFIRSQNVYDNGLITDDIEYISEEIDKGLANSRVCQGDVLLNITGGSIGRCCVYPLDKRANVNQHVCIIRVVAGEFLNSFVKYFINGFNEIIVNDNQQGGNRESLNFEQIGDLRICVPPFDEQCRIAALLDEKCAVIDAKIEERKGQLEKLAEYRSSAIYEYVTGKKEVAA